MWSSGIFTMVFVLGTPGLAQNQSEISGEYVEARSNHVFGCACQWSGEQVTGGKEAILAWNIKSGTYSGIPLAGVKIVTIVVGQDTLSVGSSPRSCVIFLDDAASKEQQQAAKDFVRVHYGWLVGQFLRTYYVPIGFFQDSDIADFSAGDTVHVSIRKARLPEDALSGARRWYDPFIPLENAVLGTILNNRYQGRDFDARWDVYDSGTSGYFGRFLLATR